MSDPKAAERLKPYCFQRGTSGNPGGRPKGLESRTRELLGDDIDAMIYVQRCLALGVPPDADELAEIAHLTTEQKAAVKATFSTITRRDTTDAFKALTDRGWGKPKQNLKIESGVGRVQRTPMDGLTDEQLMALAALDGNGDGGDVPTTH